MNRKCVAIVQSSYIPWKGYFDLIRAVDEFILLDDVQFTRRDWRSRNRIKTPQGLMWLTIPVQTKGRYLQTIQETSVSPTATGRQALGDLRGNYARAPFFDAYSAELEAVYARPCDGARLSAINHALTAAAAASSRSRHQSDGRRITTRSRAGTNVSSRSVGSRRHRIPVRAKRARLHGRGDVRGGGVAVRFADYAGYPEYPQLYPPFEHHVSVLDLLFSTGHGARKYLKDL